MRLGACFACLLLSFGCSLDRGALHFGDAGRLDAGDAGLICPPGYVNANRDPSDGCECQFISELDVCNGLDDDCDPESADGSEDESLGVACDGRDPDFCAGGRTGCGLDGEVVCMDDEPTPELCDGLMGDENCNGTVDEGCDCVGSETRPCGLDVGACMEGVQTCEDGTWSSCVGGVDPVDERCNGLDDNCDGTTDEPWPGLGATCVVGRGECRRSGNNICNPTADGIVCSVEPGAPSTEQCNNLDDDCDGRVDEDFGNLGDACSAGVGACVRMGTFVCNPGGTATQCSASAGMGGTEACNGIDDDCDSRVDEGLGLGDACSNGTGDCRREGVIVCAAGGLTTCNAVAGTPGTERCGAGDEDCDGRTDEGFMLGTACMSGVGDCAASGMVVCDGPTSTRCNAMEGTPGTEMCGGGDEDCDGNTDEITTSCRVNGCNGTQMCGGMCTPNPGEVDPETCDGSDEDCDGMTDEDFDLGSSCTSGSCTGRWQCDGSGGRECDVSGGGTSESCNAADDDCDGDIDEGTVCGASCSVVGGHGGSIYLACTGSRDLGDAEDYCAARGAWRIASLETDAERQAVADLVAPINGNQWWVGLRATAGDWSWASGTDEDDAGTPPWASDPGPGASCGALAASSRLLTTLSCGTTRRFICEAPAP